MSNGDQRIEAGSSSSSPHYEIGGDTMSIDSSITQYRIENGRRYHAYKDGIYWAPNDETQNESLDISHHKYLLLLEHKLLLAPIPRGNLKVLDIGTGTGIWAIDFADEYPNSTVLGTDLSPIQPGMVPTNCRFEIDDARDEWTYPPDFWDYIHIRALFGSIDDWDVLYAKAYEHLKPGGWFEQLELSIHIQSDSGTLPPENPLVRFANLFVEAAEITGRTFEISEQMKERIDRSGFVNVVEKTFKTPIGGWPADPKLQKLGQYALLTFDLGLEGFALATLTRVMGWSQTEVLAFTAQLRVASRDRSLRIYHNVRVVYGQKPESPPSCPASRAKRTA